MNRKAIKYPLLCLLAPVILLFVVSCNKESEDGNREDMIQKNLNLTISSSNKEMDTVSVDVDGDGLRDVRLVAINNQYSIAFQPAVVKTIQIERLHSNIELAYTTQYNNSLNFRLYNFGTGSLFLLYAKAFSAGNLIDSSMQFAPTQYYCTSSYVVNTVPGFLYNETVGDFANATRYAAFRMNKTDGPHYGWIEISNSNNAMNASLVSSAYSNSPKKAITIN